ncbi:MAG: hypothetical protein FWG20_00225 [Candidatus Cloacimonetes bacterium]|nr:hypothetical protein [Candidatus Cloacimonadota bacterium]
MKKEISIDLTKNFLEIQRILSDDFFSDRTIQMITPTPQNDCSNYLRQQSFEEREVICRQSFDLLLFWVRSGEVEIDFFERFMSIAVMFRGRIEVPIDDLILPQLIEMMSVGEYKDHAIYTTLEIYSKNPDLLSKKTTILS